MRNTLPSAAQIRALLKTFKLVELAAIANQAAMPKATLHKIRYGTTRNPGIDTVGKILATPMAVQKIREHPGILPY